MSQPVTLTPAQTTSLWVWLVRTFAVAMTMALMLYGFIAIDAGLVNYRGAGNPQAVEKRLEMQRRAETGQSLGSDQEITEHVGLMVTVLNKVTSPTYAFGEQGLSEAALFYATMPTFNGQVLSAHNVLGGTCMLFGALQFWPAFRRRYPLWHRAFGAVYLLAAQSAMIAAMVYLVRTPVASIYDQLTFYVGLWGLAIGVTLSLWMAVYSMLRKQIAQHQAWMCLNYGMLLTAPIQRFGWVAFGMASPDLRQLEGNYGITAMLVPLCAMLGYGLFTVNRWIQSERPTSARTRVMAEFATHARIGRAMVIPGLLMMLAAGVTTVQHMVITPGLGHAVQEAARLIPSGVIEMEDAVIADSALTRWLFTAATLLGLLAGARLMWRAFFTRQAPARFMGQGAWVLAGCGGVVGTLLLHWGIQMGMPSFETLSGGAAWVFGGVMALTFSGLLAWALARGRSAWVKEWGLFVIACLIGTPSLHGHLAVLATLDIETQFVQTGHVFRMAQYGQWMTLMAVFVYAAYSEATHRKLAR